MTQLVDASVWAALADPVDGHHLDAQALLLDSELPLAALDLTYFEIANAVGVKMQRPERAGWVAAIVTTRCGDRLVRVETRLVEDALGLAVEHGLSAYDAAYVAAAQRHGWQLVSIDHRGLVAKGLAVTPDAALYP